MLTRTGNGRALCTALWVQNGATAVKKCMPAHEQIKLKLSCDSAIPQLSRDAQKRQVSKRYGMLVFCYERGEVGATPVPVDRECISNV